MKNYEKDQQPLYKVLNKQRTQGDWRMSKDKCSVETDDAAALGIAELYATEKSEANAQYIALSVNNLHHLAEALEMVRDFYNEIDENGFIHGSTPEFRNKIEEALNRIS